MLEANLLEKLSQVMAEKQLNDSPLKLWFLIPSLHNYCHENPRCLGSANKLIVVAARHFQKVENKQENVEQVYNFVTFLSGLQQHEGKAELFTEKDIVTSLMHILENFDFESVLDLLQDENFCFVFAENQVLSALIAYDEDGWSLCH